LYLSRGDLARALSASDRIMLTDPHLTSEWRDRGMIHYQMHHDADALKDFTRYLAMRTEPEDAPRIKQLRGQLISRVNYWRGSGSCFAKACCLGSSGGSLLYSFGWWRSTPR